MSLANLSCSALFWNLALAGEGEPPGGEQKGFSPFCPCLLLSRPWANVVLIQKYKRLLQVTPGKKEGERTAEKKINWIIIYQAFYCEIELESLNICRDEQVGELEKGWGCWSSPAT